MIHISREAQERIEQTVNARAEQLRAEIISIMKDDITSRFSDEQILDALIDEREPEIRKITSRLALELWTNTN